jgi:hypothetical protein
MRGTSAPQEETGGCRKLQNLYSSLNTIQGSNKGECDTSEYIQNFGWKISREKTAWMTWA